MLLWIFSHCLRIRLKGKFEKFVSRYYSTYRGLEPDELKVSLSKLNLQEDFIVHGIHPEQFDVRVTDQFLDDLYDSMVAKSDALLMVEEEIFSVIDNDDRYKSDTFSTFRKNKFMDF